MLITTGLYAGLLALWYLLLGARVSLMRDREQILVGDGGNPRLLSRIRAHANFAEYVPLILILMAALEVGGTVARSVLHAIGITLLVARLAHGYTMSFAPSFRAGRMLGAGLTYLLLLGLGLWCVWRGLLIVVM